jgi:hypothetical protein
MRGELRLSSKLYASRHGASAAFARSGADQFALELGKPAEHCEHEPPVRGRGVRPCVAKGTKARALVGDLRQYVEKVASRARQPVKSRHHKHVTLIDFFEGFAQSRAVGLCAARCLLEHFLGSGGAQSLHLSVNALVVGRNAGIAENHGMILHRKFATEKPF